MANYQPQYYTLAGLFERRLFRIPNYQRAYRWESKHRAALFEDIKRVRTTGVDEHFMSTVVGLSKETVTIITDEYRYVDIVDGQQRITTLVLLFKAISKALGSSNEPNVARVRQELEETLVKPDKSLLLLQTNHDVSHHFANYIRYGHNPAPEEAKTLADRHLLTAIKDCEEFVKDWQNEESSLGELVVHLKNRLSFVLHEVQNQSEVYNIFEVLNNRGIEVSSLEQLKSSLMSIVFESGEGNKDELITEIQEIWTDIYSTIGLQPRMDDEALRFTAALLREEGPSSQPIQNAKAVDMLRDISKGSPSKARKTSEWLRSVTRAINEVSRETLRMGTLSRIAQTRLVAIAVKLRPDLTKDEKARLLHRLEVVSFRIYGMHRKDARTAVGSYMRLAWRITKEGLSLNEILEELKEIGNEYPIEEAVKALRKGDFYKNQKYKQDTRYFFYKYEEYLAKEAGQVFSNVQWDRIWESNPADSIEHILPQKGRKDDSSVHWLGNLVMLPPKWNSSLKAKAPKDKSSAYIQTGLLVAQNAVKSIERTDEWSESEIIAREKDLLEWAAKEWAD